MERVTASRGRWQWGWVANRRGVDGGCGGSGAQEDGGGGGSEQARETDTGFLGPMILDAECGWTGRSEKKLDTLASAWERSDGLLGYGIIFHNQGIEYKYYIYIHIYNIYIHIYNIYIHTYIYIYIHIYIYGYPQPHRYEYTIVAF
jgi:hypothetical protein